VTRAEPRATNVTSSIVMRRVPWRTESILIAATSPLFAEGVETGILVGTACGRVLHPSAHLPCRRPEGARRARRRELVSPESQATPTNGRWPFAHGSSVHVRSSSSLRPSSAQPSVGFLEPLRTRRREERRTSAPLSRIVLHSPEDGVVGAAWLAAAFARNAKAVSHALRAREGLQGKQRQRKGAGVEHPPVNAREDRTLEVVLARR